MVACHGLRNSSNSVEKANDLLVSYRQKHNGTSWTRFVSTGLALICALVLNERVDIWVLKRKISFKLSLQSATTGLNVANQDGGSCSLFSHRWHATVQVGIYARSQY